MIALAALLVFAGCLSLAGSQTNNWTNVTGQALETRTRTVARVLGWAWLLAALLVSVAADGVGFAALVWPLLFAVASLGVALILGFRPTILKPMLMLYSKF